MGLLFMQQPMVDEFCVNDGRRPCLLDDPFSYRVSLFVKQNMEMFPLRLSATLEHGEVAKLMALLTKSLEIFLHVPVGSLFEPFILITGLECLLA